MKVSFDFDGCLGDNKFVQMLCKLFISSGQDVFILTSRDPQMTNLDVWKLADEFEISKENVIMTNGTMKVHKFLELGIDIHFDNSFDEIVTINDLFTGDSPIRKLENLPGILTNFDSEEMGFIYNFIK